jgi:L-iditol 2-dehydrogenase/galactitol-1-phosphate 5-dehydrogenase
MKALVLESNALLYCKEIDEASPRSEREVLVQVKFAGICGSDLPRAFKGKAYHYPLVMGHEFSGLVLRAPADSAWAEGDRVVAFPLIPCLACQPCLSGDYAQCEHYDYLGSRRDGAFAERVYVPEASLFRVPDRVDLLSASMTEPCAVALHGVEKLKVRSGMNALVIGGGPIGLMVAQWLRVKGLAPVFVADIDEAKLALARKLGFQAIDSGKTDLAAEICRLVAAGSGTATSGGAIDNGGTATSGGTATIGGTDCVVEACGLPSTFLQAIQCAGRFGQVVFMGNIQGNLSIPEKDVSRILRNEISIAGTWNSKVVPRGADEWTRVLDSLDGEMDVRSLVSHVVSLEEGPGVFRRMAERSERFDKVVFAI